MDKQGLLQLLRSIQSSTPAEAAAVTQLTRQFPYSQAIQALAAKALHDHDDDNAPSQLSRSATYCTDRAVLKSLIALPRISAPRTPTAAPVALDGEHLREELSHDLKRLKKLKSDFEHTLERFEEVKSAKNAKTGKGKTKKKDQKKENPQRKALKKKEGQEVNSELLLSRIEAYRGKAKKTIKNKKQIEIIDRFIKRQPTIVRKPASGKPDVDLSKKSVELTQEVVSTTLADLLISQGKKERAIEVLKKLIWKFPQKKAIFAARIEELKK